MCTKSFVYFRISRKPDPNLDHAPCLQQHGWLGKCFLCYVWFSCFSCNQKSPKEENISPKNSPSKHILLASHELNKRREGNGKNSSSFSGAYKTRSASVWIHPSLKNENFSLFLRMCATSRQHKQSVAAALVNGPFSHVKFRCYRRYFFFKWCKQSLSVLWSLFFRFHVIIQMF